MFPMLSTVNLAGNDISKALGWTGCGGIRSIDISGNRIRSIAAGDLVPLTALTSLRLADNGLKQLGGLAPLQTLQVLDLTGNRVHDMVEIEKLAALPYLADLRLQGNPVCRRQLYRLAVLRHLDLLHRLDDTPATDEEKQRASAMFDGDEGGGHGGGGGMPGVGGGLGHTTPGGTVTYYTADSPHRGGAGGG